MQLFAQTQTDLLQPGLLQVGYGHRDDPALAGITILAMTANAFDEDRKKARECGMDGFLSKPIVIEELIGTLRNNLVGMK